MYGVTKKDNVDYSNVISVDRESIRKNEENDTIKFNQQHSTDQKKIVLPSFDEMIKYVYEMNKKRLSSSSTQRYTYGRVTLAYSYECFTEVNIKFII